MLPFLFLGQKLPALWLAGTGSQSAPSQHEALSDLLVDLTEGAGEYPQISPLTPLPQRHFIFILEHGLWCSETWSSYWCHDSGAVFLQMSYVCYWTLTTSILSLHPHIRSLVLFEKQLLSIHRELSSVRHVLGCCWVYVPWTQEYIWGPCGLVHVVFSLPLEVSKRLNMNAHCF